MTDQWKFKWASDLKPGDVIKLPAMSYGIPVIVSRIVPTPKGHILNVYFEGGGKHRFFTGTAVNVMKEAV